MATLTKLVTRMARRRFDLGRPRPGAVASVAMVGRPGAVALLPGRAGRANGRASDTPARMPGLRGAARLGPAAPTPGRVARGPATRPTLPILVTADRPAPGDDAGSATIARLALPGDLATPRAGAGPAVTLGDGAVRLNDADDRRLSERVAAGVAEVVRQIVGGEAAAGSPARRRLPGNFATRV